MRMLSTSQCRIGSHRRRLASAVAAIASILAASASRAQGIAFSPAVANPDVTMGSPPATAVFNGRLYTAFRSNDTSNTLFVTSSSDGNHFGTATGYPSVVMGSAPAMTVFGGKLYVAFQANDSSHDLVLTSSSDGVNFAPATPFPAIALGGAPALAVFNNQLVAGFQAGDASNRLVLATSADGSKFSTATSSNILMGSSPSLASFNNQLYVAFQANDPRHDLFVSSSSDGVNFPTATDYPNVKIGSAPSLAVVNGALDVAFQADDPGNALFVTSSTTGSNFPAATESPYDSIGGPPAANDFQNNLSIAFKSNNDQNVLYATGGQVALKPCDILASSSPAVHCVAAHSTVRALYGSYSGPLYQVVRASDNTTLDIGLLGQGGYANAASQDSFCANTTCMITKIYDQSPEHNDLTIEGPGQNGGQDVGAPANALPVTAGGHQVYGVEFSGRMGYRNDNTQGVARNGQPEGMYMVTSGTHVNQACCFDYGNAEVNNNDNGNGHMDTLNFGTECYFGGCQGSGPWVLADMENGLFESDRGVSENPSYTGNPTPFVTAYLGNNGQDFMELRSGDATTGPLTTIFSGGEPTNQPGYKPMQQEGAIVLGTGGDDSNGSIGSFFEGVMTAGTPNDQLSDQVQANILSVGYGAPTGLSGSLTPGSEVSLKATTACCTNDYISETPNALVGIAPLAAAGDTAGQQMATWIVRPGLANSSCLSFEAKASPGDYIRHSNSELHHDPDDGSALFANDATFCPIPGENGQGSSFQSLNYSNKLIRHYNFHAYIASNGGSNVWDSSNSWSDDTSFLVVGPASP